MRKLKNRIKVLISVADQLEEDKNKNFIESKIYFEKLILKYKDANTQLHIALIEGQEIERRRISETLHDGIGQVLAALKMHVSSLESVLSEDKYTMVENNLSVIIMSVQTLVLTPCCHYSILLIIVST